MARPANCTSSGHSAVMAAVGLAAVLTLICLEAAAATDVQYAPQPILDNLRKMHVAVGDNVTIMCSVELKQGTQFVLDMDYPAKSTNKTGHVVCSDATVSNTDEIASNVGKTGVLKCVITNVTLADKGIYTCHLKLNNTLSNSASDILDVHDKGTKYVTLYPQNTEKHIEIYATEENVFTLRVDFKAHPEVDSIEWFKGYQKIVPSERSIIDRRNDQTRLKLTNVTAMDSGNYSVVVSNGFNSSEWRFSLHIFDEGAKYVTLRPQNTDKHITLYATEENVFTLRVYFKAHPEVDNIEWFKGNEKIVPSERSIIDGSNDNTRLKLTNVTVMNSGNYSVEVSNGFNSSKWTFSLQIYDKPHVTLQTSEAYRHNIMHKINCSVVGFPKSTIKWSGRFCGSEEECDGTGFTEYEDRFYTVSNSSSNEFEQISTLTITVLESGQVTCAAHNDEGRGKQTAHIVATGYVAEEVVIFPDTNQTMINSGEDLYLECSYTKPVYWVLPETVNTSNVRFNFSIDGSTFRASLELQSAIYSDTDYYKCLHNDSLGEIASDSIYVYVKDSEQLFVKYEAFTWMRVTEYSDLTIPCRVTSPEVNVTLTKEKEELTVGILRSDGLEVLYDHTVGFTLLHMGRDDGGFYECCATLGDIRQCAVFLVEVKLNTSSLTKPLLSDTTKMRIEIGDKINISCFVEVKLGTKFTQTWNFPNTQNISDHRLAIEKPPLVYNNDMLEATNNLVIYNATHADEGTYVCIYKDYNQLENNASVYLKVHEKNTTYLNISLQGDQYSLKLAVEEPAKWVFHITAHPEAEIHWLNPDGKEIMNTTFYTVITTKHSTTFKISQVKIYDTGNYTLVASNNADTKKINVSLTVYDRLMVIFEGKELYEYNEDHKLNCLVIGNPPPVVTWFYRKCRIPRECVGVSNRQYDNSSYTPLKEYNKSSWVSTLVVREAKESGQISCRARNSLGESSGTINFIVTDLPFIDDEIWFTVDGETFNSSQQPVEKDNVTLHCGVPVSNYTSKVLWLKGENLISNTSEYTVLNTSTTFSYRSSIHFPHIKKEHDGVYTCQVTRYDGDETSFDFEFNVTDEQYAPRPILDNLTKMHVAVGDNVTIMCSVELKQGTQFVLDMDYPAKSTNKTGRVVCETATEPNTGDIASNVDKTGVLKCIITNVTLADKGLYACHLKLKNTLNNSASDILDVHDVQYAPQHILNNLTKMHVAVGDNVTIMKQGTQFVLDMDYPAKSMNKTGHVVCENATTSNTGDIA